MKISILPSDYIIKTIKENEDKTVLETIFLIRALRIRNTLKEKIEIKKLQFDLKSKGVSRKKISYTKEVLSERAKQLKGLLGFIGTKQEDPVREEMRTANAQLIMGQESFWEYKDFTTSYELEPEQEIGYRLEIFQLISTQPIDELECIVIYKTAKEKNKEVITIPVKIYEYKNEYIFPLKGAWLVWGNWDDTKGHRTMHSQEFALDLIQFNDDLMLPQVETTPNEDFKMYKADVLAIADGEIVDCFSKSPENPTAPEMLSKEERREIAEKYGFVVVASGNYVVIKHPNKEYSLYAHLATDSVTVEKGEKVKQGQVIGKLGNSGNSTGPHLHFQLMDGPSLLTGRGLPCHFKNIIDFTGEKVTLIQDNLTVVHTVDK
ncbi:MAG: M23 family metallopeptidase [Asgard group archaeon]|nr:M23 family metallopeptidase [Asgard group archaeon]